MYEHIKAQDPVLYEAIMNELNRQQTKIELIASENFVSPAVLEANGSVLTNKYAEGYPGRRYYGGCEYVDIVEQLAIDRAKELFGAEHANVQPHAGAIANMAAFYALLEPGDKVLGMKLSHGGHLTHGRTFNFSGHFFESFSYGVRKDDMTIDFDEIEEIAMKEKPKMIIAGASAYPREIDFKKFREIADKCGAYLMVDMAHIAGLVAAGLHMNPVPYADVVTTTTHKTLRGARGALILCKKKYAKDIDKAVFPGVQGGPLMHCIAGKCAAFGEALTPEFKAYQQQVVNNAQALAKGLMDRKVELCTGGTDNHLILVNLTNAGITGDKLQHNLDEVNITANMNTIPFDTQKSNVTSGLRIGTPAVTTRGMKEEDMDVIASCIADAIFDFDAKEEDIKQRVADLLAKHPLYKDFK